MEGAVFFSAACMHDVARCYGSSSSSGLQGAEILY